VRSSAGLRFLDSIMQSIQMLYFAYKYHLDSVVFMRRITIFSFIIKGEGNPVSVAKLFVRYYYLNFNVLRFFYSIKQSGMYTLYFIPI